MTQEADNQPERPKRLSMNCKSCNSHSEMTYAGCGLYRCSNCGTLNLAKAKGRTGGNGATKPEPIGKDGLDAGSRRTIAAIKERIESLKSVRRQLTPVEPVTPEEQARVDAIDHEIEDLEAQLSVVITDHPRRSLQARMVCSSCNATFDTSVNRCLNCGSWALRMKLSSSSLPLCGASAVSSTDAVPPTDVADNVNHPPHYNFGRIEVIDAIQEWGYGPGFMLGNAIKYIARAPHKGNELEDLKKARWYLNRHIQELEAAAAKQEKSHGKG